MKKQLLALVLGMIITGSISADTDAGRSAYWQDEDAGGVKKVVVSPVYGAGDVVEGTGKIVSGEQGGVEEIAKAPFKTAAGVLEGGSDILQGNW